MKKILSIILTILMVANFGLVATVSADGEATVVNFTGNGTNLLEIPVTKAQTTGTLSGSDLTLTAGQSVTYTINSNEATPVKFWWNSHASFPATTYDVTVNGTKVVSAATLNHYATTSNSVPFENAATGHTFDFVEGDNAVTFTVVSGSVTSIKSLYVADAEYKVSATGTTEINALGTVNDFKLAEFTQGDGDNWFRVWRAANQTGQRWPKYILDVEEAGNYDIFLPSQTNKEGVHEFNWTVQVINPDDGTIVSTYAAANTSVATEGTYKAATVPLAAGKNTIRLDWNGTLELGPQVSSVGVPGVKFKTFTIAKEQAPAVNFAGNSATLTGFSVANTLTTGTRYSGKVKLEAGQSITYKIVSDEATPVRLWWNAGITIRSAVTYNLIVNGEKVVNGATLATSGTGTTQIGGAAVNFVEGANDVVFEVVSGEFLEISKLYIADVEYTVGTESTVIPTMATVTSAYAVHEFLTAEGVSYREFVTYASYKAAQLPVYNLYVTEAGYYDVYLPTNADANGVNEFKWTVTIDPDVNDLDAGEKYFVDTTVETAGTYKAVTIPLKQGANTIRLEWHSATKGIQSSAFTTFTLTKAADPNLVTATVTGTIADGLAVSADLSNHDGNQVMAILAVYKVKNGVKQLVASDVDTTTATTTAHSLETAAVAAEDGYTYEYKVFVWNASTYAPYPVEIN